MDTALITGMFETSFMPGKQVEMDVQNENTQNFSKILETTLKNNDVAKAEKANGKINKDVSNEQVDKDEKIEDSNVKDEKKENEENGVDNTDEALTDVKDSEVKTKKKDKKEKVDKKLNNFVSQNELTKSIKKDNLLKEDVENKVESIIPEVSTDNKEVTEIIGSVDNKEVIKLVGSIDNKGNMEITPEEKLNDLLNKLDVKINEEVKVKDDSEQVIEVGPQSVETEKIKLNIKDVELKMKNNYGNIIASNEKINIPTIQNPFKLKRLSEEISELSQEMLPIDEENIKDVENEMLELGNDQNAMLTENINGKELFTNLKSKKDVNKEDIDVNNKGFNEKMDESKINDSLKQSDFNQNDEAKEHGKNNKEDKIKIKDFRNKKEVDFKQEVLTKEDVKIENKFEIKDVNNIRKFENFVEQDVLDQVTEKLEVSLFDNKSEMVIKLKPNDLGNVTVKISIENGVMNAKFLADSMKVKETLESNLNNLKETLKDQGLNVQDLSVSVDSGRSQNNQTFEQNRVVYLNNKKDYQVDDKSISYEDTYYEFSDINTSNARNYWMDSTVSFLA